MNVNDIKWVHVEASSKCNAWCPACPRNNHGFGIASGVVEQDLSPSKFENIIAELPNLETVQLCGNLGDPIASIYIHDLIDISKKYATKIQIHTNGSLRNSSWWGEFAQRLNDIEHDVWFGIDGLAGVHEIYRQGTNFKKIIDNAQSFIAQGGHASWQFIPYKHNEHQIKECLKLSQQLNFKKFRLAKLYRTQTLAKHYKTGEEFDLLPSDSVRNLIKIGQVKKQVEEKNCMHLSIPSIYVSAAGDVSRCCYLSKNEKFSTINKLLETVITNLSDKECIRSCG